jgi:hypothetical protein
MKHLTMFLPESTHEMLDGLAKSTGIELSHFCSNVLTDYAADNQRVKFSNHKEQSRNGEPAHIPQKNLLPDKIISEKELIEEIVTILKKQGGPAEKVFVEKTIFERNKGEFSKPYWQTPVGGDVPRWQKNTQFARNSACKLGWIKSPEEAGRGIWELTEKGRKWNFE